MANRYSVPSPGEAFATSFGNAITPYLNAKSNQFSQKEEDQFNTWRGQWAKLKESWTTQQTDNAELVRKAGAITDQIYSENQEYTREDLQAHVLSDLLLRGDVDATLNSVTDQVWNGALRTRTQLENATRENVNSLATNKPPAELDVPTAAERETVSLFFAGQENTGGMRPDALSGLTTDFTSQLNGFYGALPEDIRDNITIGSGYRSPELQAQLRANKEAELKALHPEWTTEQIQQEAGKWVGSATGSRHTRGNAVDLYYKGQRLDKAPKEVIDLVHGAAKGTGIHFPLGNEAWHAEARGTRDEGYAGTARSTDSTPSVTRFSTTGLPTIGEEMEELGLGERMSEGVGYLFGQDENYYITSAQRRFRKYLEENGELDLYMQFQNGTKTFKPISSVSPLVVDQDIMRQEVPSLFDIKDASGWEDVNSLMTSGAFTPTAKWKAGFEALGEKLNAMAQYGLERNLSDVVGNPEKITNAYDIISGMDEKTRKATVPAQYWETIEALYKANEARDTQYSDNPVINELTKLQLAATREKTENPTETTARDALKAYEQNTLSIVMQNEAMVNPDSDAATRISYLLRQRDNIDPQTNKEEWDALTAKIEREIRNERVVTATTSGLEGATVRYVRTYDDKGIPDGGYEKVEVSETMDTQGNKVLTNALTGSPVNATDILPLDDKLIDEKQDILSTFTTDARAYNKAGLALQDSMGLAIEIVDLARDPNNRQIFNAPTTMSAVTGLNRLGNEMTALLDITQAAFEGEELVEIQNNPEIQRKVNSLEAALEEVRANGIGDAIADFQMLKARQLLLIYRVGSLEGQSGTAMSNKDFTRLQTAMTSTNPQVVVTNLYEYFNGKIAAHDTQMFQLMNSPKITNWEQQAGLGEGSFFGTDRGFIPLKTLAENTFSQRQKDGYAFFTGSGAPSSTPPTTPDTGLKVGDDYMGLGAITEIGEDNNGKFVVINFDGVPTPMYID